MKPLRERTAAYATCPSPIWQGSFQVQKGEHRSNENQPENKMPISPTDTGKSNRTSVSRISAYFEIQTGHLSSIKKTLLAFQLDGMRLSTKGATLELSQPAFD